MPRRKIISDEEVLRRALPVMAAAGPHGFTLADLAREVGVSPATLFPFDESGKALSSLGAPTIAVGATVTARYRVVVGEDFRGTEICNKIIVTSDSAGANAVDNVCIPADSLTVVKTSSATGPIVPGQTLTYSIVVTNNGRVKRSPMLQPMTA